MANPWVSCCRPGYDGFIERETIMFASMFFGLGLMTQPASADLQLIRYDSYADDGDMIYGGYFSDAATGFGKNNCMGMVYSFDKEQYPLELKGLNIFWAGEGAGVTQEAMMRMYIDWYEGEADEFIMRNGAMYRRLENKKILVAGIDLEGTWQELDFETESIRVDFDPDVPGIQPITYGSVVVSMCYVNEQMLPEIAMDVDGFAEEPPPEDGDDYLDGHETSRFRSLIYWNGLWTTSDEYLLNTYGFADGGDFIMRLIIDAQVSEDDDATGCEDSADWNVNSISPDRMEYGAGVDVLLSGDWNFPADANVYLGEYELLSVNVNANCGIEGRVDPNMKAGTYDVIVESAGVRRGGVSFTVEDKKGGCASVSQKPAGLLWFLPLAGLALRRRRG